KEGLVVGMSGFGASPPGEDTEGEEGGTDQAHPEEAEWVGAEEIEQGALAGGAGSDKAVVPPGEGIDQSEDAGEEPGDENGLAPVAPAGAEAVRHQDPDGVQGDEEVVDPKHPEAEGGGSGVQGR